MGSKADAKPRLQRTRINESYVNAIESKAIIFLRRYKYKFKNWEIGADFWEIRSVLTHCNAGGLATGGYGTALGVIRSIKSN